MLRLLVVICFVLPLTSNAQDYFDLLRFNLTHNFAADFEGSDAVTTVNSVEAKTLFHTARFTSDGFRIGGDFYYYKVQVFPNSEPVDLYSTKLKVGYVYTFSDRITADFYFHPKLASDYRKINSSDVYLGATVLFKQFQSRRFQYKYGLYVSDEAYGLLATPILGLYYISDRDEFEADFELPFSADINFALPHFRMGVEYHGFNQSFRIYDIETQDVYVEQKRLEFGAYLRLRTLSERGWAKAMIGYAMNSIAVYDTADEIDFYFIDFAGRDDRMQLNPDIQGSLFFKVELIYRIEFN